MGLLRFDSSSNSMENIKKILEEYPFIYEKEDFFIIRKYESIFLNAESNILKLKLNLDYYKKHNKCLKHVCIDDNFIIYYKCGFCGYENFYGIFI